MNSESTKGQQVLSTSPTVANVAGITNFLGMGALAFFLNGSANQQLNGQHETREAIARVEVRVAGIDPLREQLAALRKDVEELRDTAATASELAALQAEIARLQRRLEQVEACARDRKRCD